jgi:hypothetical protein
MLKSDLLFLTAAVFVLFGLFTIFHGMFLTSESLPNNSGLSPLDDTPQWFERKSKVIMLVIDGLRYDYLFKDEEVPQKELYKLERFHLFHELFEKSPENIVVCKTFADTPTSTVQKIPSIVTGTMAPKVNVIMAFGALPIKEDNLMRQAHLAGQKPYFSGDSLWNGYFPNDLIDTTETRDFDIKNPNVDDASFEFIEQVVKKKKDWNLIIGHLLAVDHMGHAYGLGDQRMAEGIKGMDKLLRKVINLMDDDTTLMIVGDHGMDFSGEHGRDSPGETNTVIVGYSKKGFQKYKQNNLHDIMRSINETTKLVKQEDFTPTISMLLGLPIPFSNMGQVLSDMYPVGSFPQLESCPESSFEAQLLRDNYINTLQIRKYFKENQQQNHLFKAEDLHYIKKLFQEIESDYQEIQEIIQNPGKCSQIHEMVVNTIKKCQFFATEVYRVTRNTGSYNVLITLLGIFSIILVSVCYMLITQYIYNHGQQENKLEITFKNIFSNLKKLLPLGMILPIVTIAAWYLGLKRGIYGFTAAFLTLVLWFIGSLSISLIKKQDSIPENVTSPTDQEKILAKDAQAISINAMVAKKEETEIEDPEDLPPTTSGTIQKLTKQQDQTPLFNQMNESTPFLPSRTLFLLQDYKYTIALTLIFGFSIYLIHIKNFLVLNLRYAKPLGPYIAILAIGYRIGTIFRNKLAFIMTATVILCGFLRFENFNLTREDIRTPLGLLLAGDWVYGEVYYIVKGLKTNRAWGFAHFISFGLVALYNSLDSLDVEGFWVEIALPRAVWAMLIGTLILRKVFKVEPEVWKRNAQVCLVILLFLFRRDREVLPLALVLVLMRPTTQLFSEKADKKNYILPVMLAFEAYVGLFALQLTDVLIPFNFAVAFIGLNNFSMLLSPLIYLLNYLSTFILAFVHLSHHQQHLDSQVDRTKHVQLQDADEQVSEETKSNSLSIGHVQIMKKRNIMLYIPYFNLVMISAAIRLFVFREFEFYLVFEKFFLDALLYLFAIGVGYFML